MPPRPCTSSTRKWSADAISWKLRSDIGQGVLLPGEFLDLEVLAHRFYTTRDQVLSAIVQLSADGLICIHPHVGVIVSRVSITELLEMMELLAELEGACTKLATKRLTHADAAVLRESVRRGASAGDARRYGEANTMFHEVLYRACRNSSLTAEIARVRARTQVYRRSPFEAAARVDGSCAEHEAIMAAVLSGSASSARDRMVEHILVGGRDLATHLSLSSGVLLGFDTDYPGRRSWSAERQTEGSDTTVSPAPAGCTVFAAATIAEIVGEQIVQSGCFRASLEDVACAMGISRRTLVRKLQLQGLTFQGIKDRLRCAIAENLVREGRESIAGIADVLGFADPSSFHRAFRAWTGMTPKECADSDSATTCRSSGGMQLRGRSSEELDLAAKASRAQAPPVNQARPSASER